MTANMSVLEFIASVVHALAWPAGVATVALVFRRQLRTWMAERPEQLKVLGIEINWRKSAETIRALAPAAVSSSLPPLGESSAVEPPIPLTADLEELRQLATDHPELSVQMAFRAVEQKVAAVLKFKAPDVPREGRSAAAMAMDATAKGVIDARTAEAIEQLAVMRNLAAIATGLEADKALEFLVLADAVLTLLGRNVPG